jgi:UDP-N-acetylglucosamine 2-epimerase (non-hydrolysing)
MKSITTIIGTRPELVKMSLLIPLLDKNFKHTFIFLGQHYSDNMVKVFFDELGIRKPDISIPVNSSVKHELIAALEPVMEKDESDYVLVYGDTNASLRLLQSNLTRS